MGRAADVLLCTLAPLRQDHQVSITASYEKQSLSLRCGSAVQPRTLRGRSLTFFLTTFHFATVGRRTGAARGAANTHGLLVTTSPMPA